jgi:hypothetical protein
MMVPGVGPMVSMGSVIGKSNPNIMQIKIKIMVAQANYMCRVMWYLNANIEEYRAA